MLFLRVMITIIIVIFTAYSSASGAEGIFVDSPVSGLRYETDTYSGSTNAPGAFKYSEGETVKFYIGSLLIGESIGKSMISPIDLVPGAADETHPTVTNICRLLQSLDSDLNLGTGIRIGYYAGEDIEGRAISFDQDTAAFGVDPEVTGLFDALNARNYFPGNSVGVLLSASLAQSHLRATLMNWDKQTHPWDSDLVSGFPTGALRSNGSFHSGPFISCLVGNVDNDPELEIFFSGLGAGPLYGINHDGTLLNIYGPASGVAYPALGYLQNQNAPLSVVFGTVFGDFIEAYEGNGTALPGWPVAHANYISAPPSTGDSDNDGRDEIFINEEDGCIHAYRADGSILQGWPFCLPIDANWSQRFTTPAIGDLDDDGQIEIVAVSSPVGMLYAINADGTVVDGFPVKIPAHADSYPVIGDVDQDGDYEIIVGGFNDFRYDDSGEALYILSSSGAIEHRIDLSYHDCEFGTTPALADLDADGHPEIIYQTRAFLFVYKYESNTFMAMEGWPQRLSQITNPSAGFSSPVVGDIDGDGAPEIVVSVQNSYSGQCEDEVRAYEINGYLHQQFPKVGCLGSGGTPAIADIDADGGNEIIVRGSEATYDPLIFVYDLSGNQAGTVEWGQYGRDSKHSNFYPKPKKSVSIINAILLLLE